MACKYTYQGKTYEAWEFVDVLASMPATELMKYLPAEARQKVVMASGRDARFVHDFLQELAFEDGAFRYPITKSKSLQENMLNALPASEYLGEDTRPDERTESQADRRFVFAMPPGEDGEKPTFYVFTRDDQVWIDVSRLAEGGQGSAVYHAIGNWAYNTGKKFVGDPNGLTEDAVIRRTVAMLSSALRFGTTEHLGASPEMIKGNPAKGIEPLDWRGSDLDKTLALIHTFIKTLQNQYPGIKNARYDFNTRQFVGANNLPIRRGDGVGSFVAAGSSPAGRAARAGEATLRRGILIQSLMAAEGGERPGILEHVLRGASQLVRKDDGGLDGLFSISFNPADYRGHIERASPKIASLLHDLFTSSKTFNFWDRTLGTQYGKAQKDADFKKVFEASERLEQDTSRFASEAADLAPDLIPKMDTLREAWAQRKFVSNTKDFNAVSPFVWFGTLAGINLLTPENIHFLKDPAALVRKYGDILPKNQPMQALTDHQIDLFKQYHAAAAFSLDTLAKTEMTRLAKMSKLQEAGSELSMIDTALFYYEQIAGEMETLAQQIADLEQQHKAELELLEDAANDEASSAEQRKTYAKLLIDIRARHKEEMAPLQSSLAEFQTLKDGFIGKAGQIEKLKAEGYAPLMRFGKYTVDVVLKTEDGNTVKDNDGNEIRPFFGMFESESERNAVAREMREMYPDHEVSTGVLSEYQRSLFKGINPETAEAYARMMGLEADAAFQKYLKLATANRSAMKRLIHRKGMAGFSFDVTRNLASFITSNARASSANLHMSDMMRSVTDIPKEKGDVADEAIKLLDFVRNPQEKGLAVRSLMFFQFLGGSLASAAVNLTQTFTTTLPYLSQAEFGGIKSASVEITKAMKLAAERTFNKGRGTGDAELDAMLKLAEEQGVVAPHEIHMLRGEASRGSSMATNNIVWKMLESKYPPLRYTSRLLDAGSALWGGFFSIAEQYNRQVSFIAAYRLAKEQGASKEDAFEMAKKAVQETQFSYSKSSRSNLGRGVVGSTVLTFKTFLINYLEFLVRLAKHDKKAFAVAVGVLFLLAGAQGLPGADDLDDVLDTLAQAMGQRGNTKEWKREVLASIFGNEEFGKAATNFLLHGISAFMPLDVSGRLSVGNIIPATSMLKKSDSDQLDDFMEMIGPVGSFTKNTKDYVRESINGGELVGGAFKKMAPKAVGDLYTAVEMLQNGAYLDYKGRKIVDTSPADAFWKAVGFQPNSVAEVRRVERLIQQDISLYRNTKTDIAELWSRGVFEGDAEKVSDARAKVAAWNEGNPERPISIKTSQIVRRVNEMKKLSSERIASAAPKDIRGNVTAVLRNAE